MPSWTIPTLPTVVRSTYDGGPEVLIGALAQREDALIDVLRHIACEMFGLHPQIVAEVFANMVPFGTPVDDDMRQFIHTQFVNHIEELRRQQGGQ